MFMDLIKLVLVLTSVASYGTPTIIAYYNQDYSLAIICATLTFYASFYHHHDEKRYAVEDIVCSLYTTFYIIVNYLLATNIVTNGYYVFSFFVALLFWYKGYRNESEDKYSYPGYIYHNIWHLTTGCLISYAALSYDEEISVYFLEKGVLYLFFFSMLKAILADYHYLYMSLINSLIVSGIFFYYYLFNYEYTDISKALSFPVDNIARCTNIFLFSYFVADMFYHRKEMRGSTWLHHIISVGIIFLVEYYDLHNLAIPFYKYEISTICLNKRQIYSEKKWFYTYIFFVLFFLLRVILFGLDLYKVYLTEQIDNNLLIVVVPLYLLQLYWFVIMCKMLLKNKEK
jgi:hypothetical protein